MRGPVVLEPYSHTPSPAPKTCDRITDGIDDLDHDVARCDLRPNRERNKGQSTKSSTAGRLQRYALRVWCALRARTTARPYAVVSAVWTVLCGELRAGRGAAQARRPGHRQPATARHGAARRAGDPAAREIRDASCGFTVATVVLYCVSESSTSGPPIRIRHACQEPTGQTRVKSQHSRPSLQTKPGVQLVQPYVQPRAAPRHALAMHIACFGDMRMPWRGA